ncbi:MAG TPA: prolyl oligopeptidase family serine peptidase [Acidobacteriaceae bacterium]|jgi:prolyl oligopeptidase|nr:prolyl oligopeptidase family serine peptidase [Acidobacteriaceae bacterium]
MFVRFAALLPLLAASFLTSTARPAVAQAPSSDTAPLPPDKYLWLEDVHGARAMDWVKAEDARTAKVIEADPRFAAFDAEALKVSEDPNRLPIPQLRGNDVYNFWRDKNNIHGLLRKTSIADFSHPEPRWQTVLDIDALGKAEHTDWVFHGMSCLYPGTEYCILSLSVGGEDASTDREFNLKTGRFVDGGFVSPHSKQDVAWEDKDTLFIAREWGPNTMTKSGYPYIVKEWKRGTPLASAHEIFRGQPSDISDAGFVLDDAQGDHLTLIDRSITFFQSRWFVKTASGLKELAFPLKSQPDALLDGRMLLEIHEDWTPAPGGPKFTQGSLLSFRVADLLRDPAHPHPTIVFAPTADEFLNEVATTRSRIVVTTLKHVLGQAYVYTPAGTDGWSRRALDVPANSTIDIVTASDTSDAFFLSVTSFLTPSSLLAGDAATAQLTPSKSEPALFDASRDTVDQLYATSKDGTRVPYFVVHPKNMQYNGQNPTLLNAYGGFEVSMTPHYSAVNGKLWLEKGGVFVLANIRGGGEFGPAWHEAGLKTHRQRIYDDFAAVAQDLIARKITSTPHLGIIGGSNGGLLMGVEMTQHPDLYHAIVIQVPLLDMLRYEKIEAGASWVGEYGSVSVPAERAFLAKISPYNQLKPGVKYPEPFIFTTTADDRVGPEHARKFAAKMEEFHEPFLYDEITEGGHGAGADLKQEARTWAETYVYLAEKLMD